MDKKTSSKARQEGGRQKPRKISPLFLRHIKVISFGAFSDTVVGPFSPGLNVVFGKNEKGKTTLNAFVSGVLFGWEDARGGRNTYKPINAERAGALFFEDEGTGEALELSRAKNAEGAQGATALIGDIDKETFSTMFGLTSDELRGLRNTTDMTAKLLTAGSGTSASPAAALGELQSRIAEYTSKAAEADFSIVQLGQEEERLRAAIAEAMDETERFKEHDRELYDMAPERERLLSQLQGLNQEIETLTACRAGLEKLEHQQAKALEQKEGLQEEEKAARQQLGQRTGDAAEAAGGEPEQEAAVRDKIDALLESGNKLEHGMGLAKEKYLASKAAFDALLEDGALRKAERQATGGRRIQAALSALFPCVFAGLGIFLLVYGRQAGSLPLTAVGILLAFFAVMLAGIALMLLSRPNKKEEALAQRKLDAQEAMLQDMKRLEGYGLEQKAHEVEVSDFLQSAGLEEAQGSLKRARAILDERKDARGQAKLLAQKHQALTARLTSLEETVADIDDQKERLCAEFELGQEAPLDALGLLLSQKDRQRSALMEDSENINRRYGELKQELSQAKAMKGFDELKLAQQQVHTRRKESMRDYARLLLARRTLEKAIDAWEAKSQPEAYKEASRLFSLMTSGQWETVRLSPDGRLQVVDGAKTVREPGHLSLATCQQLYLSLRIALLMTAENVGRAIPVMADDILVSFDAERSRGAVKALQELASRRQVILFTCHGEIVRLVQSCDPQVNILEL